MYGPNYVWFLSSESAGPWIFSPEILSYTSVECDYSQIVKAAEGFLTIAEIDIRKDIQTTISGLVSVVWKTKTVIQN